jgi:hypothetical protein
VKRLILGLGGEKKTLKTRQMAGKPEPKALRARPLSPGDGAAAAVLMRPITPLAPAVAKNLARLIDTLIDEDRVIGGLVEEQQGRRPVALTLSSFVPHDFYARYTAAPWSCLTNWLLEKGLAGEHAMFLDRLGQIEGNLGPGLDLVMLDYIQDPMDWTSDEGRRVMTHFMPLFLQAHRGYNLRSMTVEAGLAYEPMALGAGYRLLAHIEIGERSGVELPPGASSRRGVYAITREQARLVPPSSPISAIFTYHPPRFRFTAGEQRVLSRAIEGFTDDEIAAALRVSHDAVKQTWRSIYDHVFTVMPELVVREGEAATVGIRGQEKRRRVSAYLRDNAQELRPHVNRRS